MKAVHSSDWKDKQKLNKIIKRRILFSTAFYILLINKKTNCDFYCFKKNRK